jgi:hypothetical protein
MKTLVKTSLLTFSIIALFGCQKTEFIPLSSGSGSTDNLKVHEGADVIDDNAFTDKDKCKKCHTGSTKTMGIDWNAPYMSDNRYNSIEELIANFDFVNNVHLKTIENKNITTGEKQDLVNYLKNIAIESAVK